MEPTYTDAQKTHVAVETADGISFPTAEKFAADNPDITPADYVDPRTLQQIYDEEVLASLDRQVLKDAARMVEDFYDALVDQLPQSMKDKHGPLMAERKTKRAARP